MRRAPGASLLTSFACSALNSINYWFIERLTPPPFQRAGSAPRTDSLYVLKSILFRLKILLLDVTHVTNFKIFLVLDFIVKNNILRSNYFIFRRKILSKIWFINFLIIISLRKSLNFYYKITLFEKSNFYCKLVYTVNSQWTLFYFWTFVQRLKFNVNIFYYYTNRIRCIQMYATITNLNSLIYVSVNIVPPTDPFLHIIQCLFLYFYFFNI